MDARRRPRIAALSGWTAALLASFAAACVSGSNPVRVVDDSDSDPGPAIPPTSTGVLAWLGDYTGFGDGVDMGVPFETADVALRIAFDADSVALAGCPFCVTIELPPWFVRANVFLRTGGTISVTFTRDSVIRTFSAEQFSEGHAVVATVRHVYQSAEHAGQTLSGGFQLLRIRR